MNGRRDKLRAFLRREKSGIVLSNEHEDAGMSFPPIVDRELRIAARRHSTYWRRQVVALGAIVVGVLIFLGNLQKAGPALAQDVFIGLAVLAMLYGLAAGRLFTADCLSQEKRDGTLGLLFLTDLKGSDVVLGKLAVTSLSAFYGLVALVPVLAVPLLMGGITNGEFWRLVLVLVNTLLFSLAIGIFVSALSWMPRAAMGANFLVLLIFLGALPGCAAAIDYFHSWKLLIHPFFFACPAYSCFMGFDFNYSSYKAEFWWSVGVTHAVTWLLVALASWMIPRAWQDKAAGGDKKTWRERRQTWIYGRPAKRKALRLRLLALNPFCWLAARSRFKPFSVWIALGFIAGWWLYVRLRLSVGIFDEAFSVATAILLNSLLKLWIAIESVQKLAEDHQSGALELLLSTPLSVRDIVRGQLLALRRQFLGPLLVVLVIEVFLAVQVAHNAYQADQVIPVCELTGLVMLLCDIAAVFYVAMFSALTARSPNFASVNAISRVLILPWIGFGTVAALTAAWCSTFSIRLPGWRFYLSLWFFLGLAADLAFGLHAWWRLRMQFRELALPTAKGAKA